MEPDAAPASADPLNLADLEQVARERLSTMAYDYYAGGARDEVTLRENRAAYERIELRYRVLRDVCDRDLSTRLLGRTLSMPVLVAPTAFHRLACDEGEVATARAAAAAGTTMILSTLSTRPMEDVAEAASPDTGNRGTGSGPSAGRSSPDRPAADPLPWFQLYVYRDRGATEELVRRAEAAGFGALALTVDAQLWGVRERDVRNRFALPEGLKMPNLSGASATLERVEEKSGLAAYVDEMFDPALTWDALEWLAGVTDLPVLVKGVVHPEDGRLAVERGATGVVVSNHGGRQLDTSIATIRALPGVAAAVDEALGRLGRDRTEFPVLVDGGVRRGTDVVKALALGADAVCVGRPVLWGLAADGEGGARRVLEMIREELDLALALCGACTPTEVRQMARNLVVDRN